MDEKTIDQLKQKLQEASDMLQDLEIRPTIDNMERLLKAQYNLVDVYSKIGGDADGRTQTDAERQDDH